MSTNTHLLEFDSHSSQLENMQRQLLAQIVGNLASTDYAAHLGNPDIQSAEQYSRALPLVDYEAVRPWVERLLDGQTQSLTAERTVALFRTSGSMAKPKLIPVTASLMRQKVAAFSVFWGMIYRDYPAVATGTIVSNFIDAGTSEKHPGGLEICSESSFWSRRGRSMNTMQRWPLPAELRLVQDRDARLYAVARLLLQNDLHCIMCLNPSTLLQFCRVIEEHADSLVIGLQSGTWGLHDAQMLKAFDVTGKVPLDSYLAKASVAADRLAAALSSGLPPTLKSIWPTLQLVVCWRSGIVQPYFKLLDVYLQSVPVRDYISQSSECMMAIPVSDGGSGGALAYTSHFYEFIPEVCVGDESPVSVYAWQVELGKRYELVVTTGGGLYRYRTGDCVCVTGYIDTVPCIEFLYRIGKTSSITGEKLTEFQVLEAARQAASNTSISPSEYLCFPCTAETPRYGVIVEGVARSEADSDQVHRDWLAAFHSALCTANSEYADKWASGRLGDMVVYRADEGSLAARRLALKVVSVSDEQVKSEVLSSQLDYHDSVASAQRIAG